MIIIMIITIHINHLYIIIKQSESAQSLIDTKVCTHTKTPPPRATTSGGARAAENTQHA